VHEFGSQHVDIGETVLEVLEPDAFRRAVREFAARLAG